MEVAVRLYQPLKPVIDTHSFLVGSYQGGESDTLGSILIHRGRTVCSCSAPEVWLLSPLPSGKTTMYDLRKLVEETRKGTTNMRSRMFEDMMYHFNDAPNIHGKPESRRRKYVFGIVPARQKDYDDSKIQTIQPVVISVDAEHELFADQLLTRYNEKLTVLVIQGVHLRVKPASFRCTHSTT